MVMSAAMMINGVSTISNKSDTISRTIEIEINPFNDNFLSSGAITKKFKQDKGKLLGGFCKTIHEVIKILPKFENHTFANRFGEFCMIGLAIDEVFNTKNEVITELLRMREKQKNDHTMSDELTISIINYLDKNESYNFSNSKDETFKHSGAAPLKGNSVQVLDLLRKFSKNSFALNSLPKNGKHFLSELEMRKDDLRLHGIFVLKSDGKYNKNGIMLEIKRIKPAVVKKNDEGDDNDVKPNEELIFPENKKAEDIL
jgi:hypothetical protein